MDNLFLESSMATDVTLISNYFIDEYMPRANGDFVKVYIHLLRLLSSRQHDFSLGSMADTFNFTEGDVMRALRYWENLGLLSLTRGSSNDIKGICLEPFGKDKHYIKGVQSMHFEAADSKENTSENTSSLPVKKKYTAKEIDAFSNDNHIGQLMFIAQAYLAKPLGPTDINSLLYMYDSLSFSPDVIEYILETCISEGHKNLSYIEKTACTYYQNNIHDIEGIKAYNQNSDALCKKVLDTFGISGRSAGKDESNFVLHWQKDYGYDEDMIVEACNRTLAHTHAPSFKYANSILAAWYKSGARKLSDVKKLDEKHIEENEKKYAAKKISGTSTPKLKGGQRIQSHSYDFEDLERKLLASDK